MSTTKTEAKEALRLQLKALEGSLTPAQRRASDAALFARFLSLPLLEHRETLLLYWGMGGEPDTQQLFSPLLRRGKVLVLPRCQAGHTLELRRYLGPEHLVRHRYGMWEPDDTCPLLSPDAVSFALIPGLSFDPSGMRMGRGGGYYDRFLPQYSGLTLGLCRDVLLQASLPALSHDRGVDLVLTETRCFSHSPQLSNPLPSLNT